MHLHLKHLVAIILCNMYLMVQKLIIAYIFVFFTGFLWPVCDNLIICSITVMFHFILKSIM